MVNNASAKGLQQTARPLYLHFSNGFFIFDRLVGSPGKTGTFFAKLKIRQYKTLTKKRKEKNHGSKDYD